VSAGPAAVDDPRGWVDPARTRSPRIRAGIVQRSDLIASFERADARVVAIVAPPGFGKTTLLAQLAASHSGGVFWLTLDESDDDPVLLLSHLLEALQVSSPLGASDEDSADRGPIERRLLHRLIAELDRRADRPLLILDDLHALSGDSACDVISALVDRLSNRFRLVIGTRRFPTQLPVGRWRASRVLLEVDPGRLAMDHQVTRALLGALGVDLPDAQVEEIRRRTGGWAAAIYLVGLSIRDRGWHSFEGMRWGHEPYIADYLEDQVLGPLAPAERDLLLRSSILERLNGALCDAILERSGSAAHLEALSRFTLFLAPLDAELGWFRCHPLLRDHLSRELEARFPGELPALHGRASAWFADHGAVEKAVEHALAGGLIERAADTVAFAAKDMYERGEIATLLEWTSRLGREPVERRPRLAHAAAWVTALDGRPEEAERWIADVVTAGRAIDPGDGTVSLESAMALVSAMTCRDGPEAMLADAMRAVELEPAWSPWRHTVLDAVGYAHLMLGDLEAARSWFHRSASEDEARSSAAHRVALAECALEGLEDRRWADAEAFIHTFRASSRAAGADGELPSLLGIIAEANHAIRRGGVDRGRRLLVEAQPGRRRATWAIPWLAVRCLTELARTELLIGDASGARASITQAEEILVHRPRLGTLAEAVALLREQCGHVPATAGRTTGLTDRELRLLPLLQTYLTFQEIGDRLGISRNTVKTQAASIYAKLDATSRSEAVQAAEEAGLLVPLLGPLPTDEGD
jgi:LuxR family maltose regulon positive regulatory protein